jgi:hypothetical protein
MTAPADTAPHDQNQARPSSGRIAWTVLRVAVSVAAYGRHATLLTGENGCQLSPCEHKAGASYEPASNAQERSRNASIAG